jgi:hypothetical protein
MNTRRGARCLKFVALAGIILMAMQVIQPLQTPVTSPVIVTLSNDKQVSYTADMINELLQQSAIIVRADDQIANVLVLPRACGEVIFVGHGTPHGIKIGSTDLDWSSFAWYLVGLRSRNLYVAACFSDRATSIVRKLSGTGIAYGFSGPVDADEAAYLIAAAITYVRGDTGDARAILSELTAVMWGKILAPEKYNHWFLGMIEQSIIEPPTPQIIFNPSYYIGKIAQVRNIWHIKYGTYSLSISPVYIPSVKYTHPDNYFHYPNITPDTETSLVGNNLFVYHYTRSALSSNGLSLTDLLSKVVTTAANIYQPALWGIYATVAAFSLLAISAIGILSLGTLYFKEVLKDEQGGGWAWFANAYVGSLGWGLDVKYGSAVWVHIGQLFYIINVIYPASLNGYYLSLDGVDV